MMLSCFLPFSGPFPSVFALSFLAGSIVLFLVRWSPSYRPFILGLHSNLDLKYATVRVSLDQHFHFKWVDCLPCLYPPLFLLFLFAGFITSFVLIGTFSLLADLFSLPPWNHIFFSDSLWFSLFHHGSEVDDLQSSCLGARIACSGVWFLLQWYLMLSSNILLLLVRLSVLSILFASVSLSLHAFVAIFSAMGDSCSQFFKVYPCCLDFISGAHVAAAILDQLPCNNCRYSLNWILLVSCYFVDSSLPSSVGFWFEFSFLVPPLRVLFISFSSLLMCSLLLSRFLIYQSTCMDADSRDLVTKTLGPQLSQWHPPPPISRTPGLIPGLTPMLKPVIPNPPLAVAPDMAQHLPLFQEALLDLNKKWYLPNHHLMLLKPLHFLYLPFHLPYP